MIVTNEYFIPPFVGVLHQMLYDGSPTDVQGDFPWHWIREPDTFIGKEYKFTPTTSKIFVVFYCDDGAYPTEMATGLTINGERMYVDKYQGHYLGLFYIASTVDITVTPNEECTLSVNLEASDRGTPRNGFWHIIEINDDEERIGCRVTASEYGGTSWAERDYNEGEVFHGFGYSNHTIMLPFDYSYNFGTSFDEKVVIKNSFIETKDNSPTHGRTYCSATMPQSGTCHINVVGQSGVALGACNYHFLIRKKGA